VGYFKDAAEMEQVLGALYDKVKTDARIAPRICEGKIVIQFRYEEPHGIVTIDAKHPPTQPGAYCDVTWGETGLKADVEMSMKADVAHQFWHGKVNLMAALTRRQIVAKGPIPKILKLLPAVEPVYELYPKLLRELGREDLALK
jgi:SCP-2 sterol transfer family